MSARGTVLVVDDDTDVRSTVAEILEEEGYDVVPAANGRDALRALLDGTQPDVILLDMMMPEMDGWAFRAEQVHHPRIASIPVVIFTAYSLPHEATDLLGACCILKKPLRLAELLSAIAACERPHP
jgi:CheY-like chemotaxis protein